VTSEGPSGNGSPPVGWVAPGKQPASPGKSFLDRHRRKVKYAALVIVPAGFLNFFWFVAESSTLGGDGLNGYIRAGHYFVVSHGTATEVSRSAWEWSRLHASLTFLSWPLVLASMAFLSFGYFFPLFSSSAASETVVDGIVAAIRASGPLLATGSPGGRLGDMSMSRGMLSIDVYPGGIVLRPRWGRVQAVATSDIVEVRPRRVGFSRGMEIHHAGVGARSPVVLYGATDSDVTRALSSIVTKAPTQSEPIRAQEVVDITSLRSGLALPKRARLPLSIHVGTTMAPRMDGYPRLTVLFRLWNVVFAIVLIAFVVVNFMPVFGVLIAPFIAIALVISLANARALVIDLRKR
jgi:hypothetical protein